MRCICATRFFLGGKSCKKWRGQVVAFKNLFSSILRRRICDRSAQFLVNCFEKFFMATNNSGFNSSYMFACKWRATGERKKRKGKSKNWQPKRIHVENLCSIWGLFTYSWSWQRFVSSCDVFACLFALDLKNEIQVLSTFFFLFLADLFSELWLRNAPLDKKKSGIIVLKNKLLLVSLLHFAGLCKKSFKITWWVSELHLER